MIAPPSATRSAVPRSGWRRISAAGREDQEQRQEVGPDAAQSVEGDAVEIARQSQHHRDLHELRGLQLDHADVDPALRALARRAQQLHADQQGEGEAVDRVGRAQPRSRCRSSPPRASRSARRRTRPSGAPPTARWNRRRRISASRCRDRADGADENDQEPVELEQPLGDAKALLAADVQLCHQAGLVLSRHGREGAGPRRRIAALNLTQDVACDPAPPLSPPLPPCSTTTATP